MAKVFAVPCMSDVVQAFQQLSVHAVRNDLSVCYVFHCLSLSMSVGAAERSWRLLKNTGFSRVVYVCNGTMSSAFPSVLLPC